MAYYPRTSKKIFSRRRLRPRVASRAKITGARAQPRLRRRRARITPRAMLAMAVGGGVLLLLILILALSGSSQESAMTPADGSAVSGSPVRIQAPLKKGVDPASVKVLVDGQDMTGQAGMEPEAVVLEVELVEGEHVAEIMVGEKTQFVSHFTVDNTPPVIHIDGVELRDDGITVFRGMVEGCDAFLVDEKKIKLGEDGSFQVEANRHERATVLLAAVDAAGNRSEMLMETSPPPQIKGIHVSIWVAADRNFFKQMVDLVLRTELNGMEIDVKDESGRIAYASEVPLALEVGSPLAQGGVDIERVMDKCWYNEIYPIARIVCFKDPILASKRPDLAVHSSGGGLWGNGQWLDPYNRENWEYILGVAQEAVRKGFKEIQLDYVRFPSDGNTEVCVYPAQAAGDAREKTEVITDFIDYLRDGLKPMGAVLSADVFGLTASDQGSMGIGQDIAAMAAHLDYMCPMVYPSHYNAGEYNIGDPEANPHDTVYASLVDFQKKLEGTSCKLRPWLQDFSLRLTYGVTEVQAQMRACYELGINEWLLWDPHCTFTEEAIQPAE